MSPKDRARLIYARLIRRPVIGPFIRLPLRIVKSLLRDPDQDASVVASNAAAEVEALRESVEQLAIENRDLRRRHEQLRLIVFMTLGRSEAGEEP